MRTQMDPETCRQARKLSYSSQLGWLIATVHVHIFFWIRHCGAMSRVINVEEIRKYFRLPEKEVAKQMGVCLTSLNKICRAHCIFRWPYRKVCNLFDITDTRHRARLYWLTQNCNPFSSLYSAPVGVLTFCPVVQMKSLDKKLLILTSSFVDQPNRYIYKYICIYIYMDIHIFIYM